MEDIFVKIGKIFGFLGVLVIILLAFVIIWNANIIGVAAGSLEKNAREEQNIASDWEMAQAINDKLCAMLFYDVETRDCVYSIYLKKREPHMVTFSTREAGMPISAKVCAAWYMMI